MTNPNAPTIGRTLARLGILDASKETLGTLCAYLHGESFEICDAPFAPKKRRAKKAAEVKAEHKPKRRARKTAASE
jgi:hypothetical protein